MTGQTREFVSDTLRGFLAFFFLTDESIDDSDSEEELEELDEELEELEEELVGEGVLILFLLRFLDFMGEDCT